ncbi:glycosyltransferase family 2 protein [Litorimonas haliclonae]|uniref:glycosyltransferase family 2 protein n=1 Tax=Litorimonas haliclonae TaxID=2081977 RepID=UPI0039EE1CDA
MAKAETKSMNKSGPRRLVTISIPTYNESENIKRLISRLQETADTLPQYDFEFLFTDNASEDDTFAILAEMAKSEPRIRALRLSRNFGFQRSILTNFLNAKGDCAIQIDADLQDPPELFPEFLKRWEEGYSVVYGVRKNRKESKLEQSFRKIGYRIIRYLSEISVPNDAGDFRLIDRKIIEQLRTIEDQTPYLRGLIASFGYAQTGIPYERDKRMAGESKFKPIALIRLGVDGIASQSVRPLRLLSYVGVIFGLFSIALIAYYLVQYLFMGGEGARGFTTLAILVLISTTVNAIGLGIMGEYLGRVFNNSRRLPIAIIDQRIEPLPAGDVAQTKTMESGSTSKDSPKSKKGR